MQILSGNWLKMGSLHSDIKIEATYGAQKR